MFTNNRGICSSVSNRSDYNTGQVFEQESPFDYLHTFDNLMLWLYNQGVVGR